MSRTEWPTFGRSRALALAASLAVVVRRVFGACVFVARLGHQAGGDAQLEFVLARPPAAVSDDVARTGNGGRMVAANSVVARGGEVYFGMSGATGVGMPFWA